MNLGIWYVLALAMILVGARLYSVMLVCTIMPVLMSMPFVVPKVLQRIIAISLIPLAYARMREAQWAMVYLDILIVCVMSLLFLFVYVSRRVRTDASYASALDSRILFGLGEGNDAIKRLRIVWPDGVEERRPAPEPSRWHLIEKGSGEVMP